MALWRHPDHDCARAATQSTEPSFERLGGARALEQHVRLPPGEDVEHLPCRGLPGTPAPGTPAPRTSAPRTSAGVHHFRGPHLLGEGQAGRLRIAHHDLGRPSNACHCGGEQADRPRSGDDDLAAHFDAGLPGGPDAHRQGLEKGAGVVREVVGERVAEVLVVHDVAGEGTIDRGCGEEAHVRAEVVRPAAAGTAAPAGDAGLHRDSLPDCEPARRPGPERPYDPGSLVAEDEGCFHDEVTDPAVGEVVHVRPAHADRGDLDQHLAMPRYWSRAVLEADLTRLDQDRSWPHFHFCTDHKTYRSAVAGEHDGALEAGWYPDPLVAGRLRWWDGEAWTEHVASGRAPGVRAARTFARRWTALALVAALFVVVLALVLRGGPPTLYWRGEPIDNATAALARAGSAMKAVARAEEGAISGDARCYFLLANQTSHDVGDQLRCGPVLLPWSRPSSPWLPYKLRASPSGKGVKLSVSLRPAPSATVGLAKGEVLRQPGGASPPKGDGGLTLPAVPRQPSGWGGVLTAPPPGLSPAPVGDMIGDWGASYRLVAYGETDHLNVALDPPALRQAEEPPGSLFAKTKGGHSRELPLARLLLPPEGEVFVVAELSVSPGEAAGPLPAQANGGAGASTDRPALEVLAGGNAVEFPASATSTAPTSLTLAAAVPAGAQAELVVSDKGLAQRVSLVTGELGSGPAILTRPGTSEKLSAEATLDRVRLSVLDASLVWFAGSDGGTVPPSFDLAYLQVLATTNPANATLPVSDFTLVMPGGELVRAVPLPDSDRQALAVGFLVPASFSDGTLVVSAGKRSLSVPVRFE